MVKGDFLIEIALPNVAGVFVVPIYCVN